LPDKPSLYEKISDPVDGTVLVKVMAINFTRTSILSLILLLLRSSGEFGARKVH